MNKAPTSSPDFWKQRINEAKGHNNEYIFYQVGSDKWSEINNIHREIISNEEVKGKVLDAGCGTGRLSEWFDDYVGVDFSPDLLEIAKEDYPDKKFIKADLKKLPFGKDEFDWAVCCSIQDMVLRDSGLEEWKLMREELLRVAKRVLILDYPNPKRYSILCKQQ